MSTPYEDPDDNLQDWMEFNEQLTKLDIFLSRLKKILFGVLIAVIIYAIFSKKINAFVYEYKDIFIILGLGIVTYCAIYPFIIWVVHKLKGNK
ncbi:MAG: hypothetical protein E7020_02405 [Alphaproteobacteria bacterium]|nr:hypothetical protein [Alphaproteobacteria bacterium]